jgi:hypothetical protein
MANYIGNSYSIEAGGKSAFWNKEGVLVLQSDGEGEDLLIVEI